jgi:hypothetical protein
MEAQLPHSQQGPFEGSRCVAGPGGRWAPATIRRVDEDGCFKIEFDVKEMLIIPHWHGITPAEISFDDERRWPQIFAAISPDGSSFALDDFKAALSALGFQVSSDDARRLWDDGRAKLSAAADVLDAATTYRLFLNLGLSALAVADKLKPTGKKPYFKLYWNQTRMGGRDPAELNRPVTLDDAFAALGLTASDVDPTTKAFLEEFERKESIRLLSSFVALLNRTGAANAVVDCHPNNPRLVDFKQDRWTLERDMRSQQLDGAYALVFMLPHQGDHDWAVAFDDHDSDARVYVRWDAEDGEKWLLTAPTIGFFFWDLAQTGLTWYQDTRFQGGKPCQRTDIGLIPT